MTILYIVSMATTTGPFGPTVSTTYHRTHQDALYAFTACQNSLGDDPSTISLVGLDLNTLEERVLESFEGTFDDHQDEIGKRYEEDEEDKEV